MWRRMESGVWLVLLASVSVGTSILIRSEGVNLIRDGQEGFELRLDIQNQSRLFTLRFEERSENVWLLGEEGELIKTEKEVLPIYQDVQQHCSVILTLDTSTSLYSVSGVLGPGLTIQPLSTEQQNTRPYTCGTCLGVAWHSIQYLNESDHGESGYEDMTNDDKNDYEDSNDNISDYEEVAHDYTLARQGRGSPSRVYPEVLVVVDYPFYKKFHFNRAATQQYIISYFNAVNFRFNSLSAPGIELSIAGIVISSSTHSLPYIQQSTISLNMVDAPSALHAMGQYYYQDRPGLPVHDMVVTITGRNLAARRNGRMDSTTTGYAYVGGACVRNTRLRKINSVAIVEDSGGYSGVVTTAHEIGHLLGAVHDGDSAPSYLKGPGAKKCSWSEGFIMSDNRRTSKGLLWSSCSINQMLHFLKTKTASCLANYPRQQIFLLPGPGSLPGQSISLDGQCFADQGTQSCYHDYRVCAQLFCYNKQHTRCLAYRPAVEGSPCGQGRRCQGGKCVVKVTSSISYSAPVSRSLTHSYSTSRKTVYRQLKSEFAKSTSMNHPIVTKVKYPKTIRYSYSVNSSQKETRKVRKYEKSGLKFQSSTKLSTSNQCVDSSRRQGSLTCFSIFSRYSATYCHRNKAVQRACCRSYRTFCLSKR